MSRMRSASLCEREMAEVGAKSSAMPSQLEASLELATNYGAFLSLGRIIQTIGIDDTIRPECALWRAERTERTKVRRESLATFPVRETKFSLESANFAREVSSFRSRRIAYSFPSSGSCNLTDYSSNSPSLSGFFAMKTRSKKAFRRDRRSRERMWQRARANVSRHLHNVLQEIARFRGRIDRTISPRRYVKHCCYLTYPTGVQISLI